MTHCSQESTEGFNSQWWQETAWSVFTRWYDDMAGKFLRAPQLGLFREHLHEGFGASEALNRLAAVLGAFALRFGRPFQDAVVEFSGTVARQEPPLNGSKEVYDAFVAVLAAKYEAFLSSTEGIDAVAEMIDGYLVFKDRLDGAMAPWFKFWAIPTKQEMADVHRQIHDLKKQNRLRQAALDQQALLLVKLQQRLDALEKPGEAAAVKTAPAKGRKRPGRQRPLAPAAPEPTSR
jgi:hypothetical protein